ncbi:FecCD family ABC transporter permease [Nakamurella leprariae]|uniref:Iron ABC transporter permease n=1 Tax=Nakamurella leprariae TaxID=2803911 RepID=A0A938YHU0_9ACTN|nr:iron ABC transporter permease [Nakamurella leprariae]
MKSRPTAVLAVLLVLAVLATLVSVCVGSVAIPLGSTLRYLTGGGADPTTTVLIQQVRMPRTATAAVVGAGLAVAGLLLQTLFANPLADPYILGVSSGAGLGVAISVLGGGSAAATFISFGATGRLATVAAAAVGALAVLVIVLVLGRWVRSVVTLLLIGVMIGAASGAVVSLLLAFSDPSRIQKYVLWGMGSVSGVTWPDLVVLAPAVGLGVVLAWTLAGPLNAMLLGERYAASLGVHVRQLRWLVIVATALIAGTVTAFCGPIAFLGIAVPHLARVAVGRADHRLLVPACVLLGAAICMLCGVLAQVPAGEGVLPLNVVTAVVGAPVVIAALLRSRTLSAGAV